MVVAVPSVRRVLVYPVNGYVNRLQALASSALFAEAVGAPLSVCWTPHPMVPGPAGDAFAHEWVERHVVSEQACAAEWGVSLASIPLYVGSDPEHARVTLRGHDRGEQALMTEFRAALARSTDPDDVVIVAGGSFDYQSPESVDGTWSESFLTAKRDYYRALPLHPAVEAAANEVVDAHPDGFIGLHLRYSDRSHQAPMPGAIAKAIEDQAGSSGLSSVFIASDSPAALREWTDRVRSAGLEPWDLTERFAGLARATSAGPALADWRVLSRSSRMVYFAESSYSVEACVASGSWVESTALATSPTRAAGHRLLTWGRAALTYPQRHWGSGQR